MQAYDLIVIGSGPAGRRAAVQAAKLKKSVLVVEKGRRVGGVCVHTGTIPSKTLRETVLNLSGWRERGFYGRAHRNKQTITSEDLRRRLAITLEFDETLYVGNSALLMSSVLSRFFGLYASVNSFTELVVRSAQRQGVWKRWQPMAGAQGIL